MHELCLVMTL